MNALTDSEIIAKHSPDARARARIELAIVDKLIDSARDVGYRLKVAEYEEDGETDYDFKNAVFNLDDALVLVADGEGEQLGWIRLVFGNSGYDLVSDFAVSLEDFLKPANDLADSLG